MSFEQSHELLKKSYFHSHKQEQKQKHVVYVMFLVVPKDQTSSERFIHISAVNAVFKKDNLHYIIYMGSEKNCRYVFIIIIIISCRLLLQNVKVITNVVSGSGRQAHKGRMIN